MYTPEEKIWRFALVSRLASIVVQFLANIAIPDHDAGVFLTADDPAINSSYLDVAVHTLLHGLVRWDGQYFFHITKYGYTYENTLAFFPMLPLCVRGVAGLLSTLLPDHLLNVNSVVLVSFCIVNTVCFVLAARTLYALSLLVLRSEEFAYKATVLFCVNPANVFFGAAYTESLFAWLSFSSMLLCVRFYDMGSKRLSPSGKLSTTANLIYDCLCISIPMGLAAATRSNGILNIGFLAYFAVKQQLVNTNSSSKCFFPWKLIDKPADILWKLSQLFLTIILALVPFTIVQLYDYIQFCSNFPVQLEPFIVTHASTHEYILPGQNAMHNQSWCEKTIPLAYSYVQDHYWNVGFLRYYQWKQIPNFLLATPVVLIILIGSYRYYKRNRQLCWHLGLFSSTGNNSKSPYEESTMFVFVAHAVFLTLFSVLFVHIQVTTRLLCSGCPVLYWFCAGEFKQNQTKEIQAVIKQRYLNIHKQTLDDYESNANAESKYWTFILTEYTDTKCQFFIKYYFLTYYIVGIILFSNFLPWT